MLDPVPPSRRRGQIMPTRVTVEAAMLAAVTGLSFHLSTLLRLDAYLGALFPLPVVVAAARWGNAAAGRTLIAATLLLLLLSGPLRATNYFFLHGVLAFALGCMWRKEWNWWLTVPISALVRTGGIFASLTISSLTMRENIAALLVNQMYALLDQMAANVGASFVPSAAWVWGSALFFVLFNSATYVAILHVVYAVVLAGVSGTRADFTQAPRKVKAALFSTPNGV